MDTELFKEWFGGAQAAGIAIHVRNAYGENSHHIIESCFDLRSITKEVVEIDKGNILSIYQRVWRQGRMT